MSLRHSPARRSRARPGADLSRVRARSWTEAQRAALAARIESFDAAMKASDMSVVLGVVPPKMLDKIAASNNVTLEQLIAATQDQINEALKGMTIESFGMDLDAAQIVALADGSALRADPDRDGDGSGRGRQVPRHVIDPRRCSMARPGTWFASTTRSRSPCSRKSTPVLPMWRSPPAAWSRLQNDRRQFRRRSLPRLRRAVHPGAARALEPGVVAAGQHLRHGRHGHRHRHHAAGRRRFRLAELGADHRRPRHRRRHRRGARAQGQDDRHAAAGRGVPLAGRPRGGVRRRGRALCAGGLRHRRSRAISTPRR